MRLREDPLPFSSHSNGFRPDGKRTTFPSGESGTSSSATTFVCFYHAVPLAAGVLDPDSSPRHIEETRRYIRDLNAIVASTSTALSLYEKMLTLHSNRLNPGSLWATAKAVKPE